MLKLKYLYENFEMAVECMKMYDYDEVSSNKIMMKYFRISSNAIYPFRRKDGLRICFLRTSPAEEKAYADVVSEIHLIDWLRENGLPVMKPFPMKDGELSKQIHTKWGILNVSCYEAVSGRTLDDIDGNTRIAFGYGKLLGQMHSILRDYPYADERRNHEALLHEVSDRLTYYHAPEFVLEDLHTVKEMLKSVPVNRETYGIVHYDFEPDNVLYDENTDSYGIIDLDDSIRCWYALDIVRALDAMDDVVEDNIEDAQKEFVKGYRSIKIFTEEQEALLPFMRRIVQLECYSTILHVLSEEVSDMPEWMEEIV